MTFNSWEACTKYGAARRPMCAGCCAQRARQTRRRNHRISGTSNIQLPLLQPSSFATFALANDENVVRLRHDIPCQLLGRGDRSALDRDVD